jgi:hypothetical protein
MRQDPIPLFPAHRGFSKLVLFAGMVACLWLGQVFHFSMWGSLAMAALFLAILLIYAELLKEQIIEAIQGNSSHAGGSEKTEPSPGGPLGDKTQKGQP